MQYRFHPHYKIIFALTSKAAKLSIECASTVTLISEIVTFMIVSVPFDNIMDVYVYQAYCLNLSH